MSACTTCGACCASFRVDFSVFETQSEGGSVPDGLWVPVTDLTARITTLTADLVRLDSRSFLSNLPVADRIEAELAGFEIERAAADHIVDRGRVGGEFVRRAEGVTDGEAEQGAAGAFDHFALFFWRKADISVWATSARALRSMTPRAKR